MKTLILLGLIASISTASGGEFSVTVNGISDSDSDPDVAVYTPARLTQQAYYPSSWQADYQYDEYGNTIGYSTTYNFSIPDGEFQRSGLLQDLVAFGLGSSAFTAWLPIQGAISTSTSDFTNSILPEPPGVQSVPGMLDIKGGQLTLSNTADGTPGALFYYSSDALVSLGNKENFSWHWSSPNPNILGSMHFPMSLSSSGSLELRDFEGGYINLYPTSGQIVVHGLSGGGAIYIEGSRVATEAYVSSVAPTLSYLSSNYMPKSPLSLGVGLNSSTLNGSGASALGQASTAHGDSAFAAGKGASALGESTVAMGGGARATQSGNIAIGQGSVSTGQPAIWQGAATGSVAVGTKAEATREVSSAFGPLARAYALESTAVGPLSRASAPYSFAAGSNTYTEATAVGGLAIGYIAGITNQYAVAVGARALGSGERANAMGFWASAGGNDAIAIGSNAVASSSDATAIGSNSTASKWETVALGHYATASGATSLALGAYSTATQQNAVAVGVGNEARGTNSFAAGYQTIAQGFGQTVVGLFNAPVGNSTDKDDPQSEILVVGAGTQDLTTFQTTRRNVLTVKRSGDTEISGSLKVNGTIRTEPAGDLSMGQFKASPQP